MTDRELLELAAKAAGIVVHGPARRWIAQGVSDHALLVRNDQGGDSVFDPLADDGDTFRLAVTLGITWGTFESNAVWARLEYGDRVFRESKERDGAQDPYAAARRAIVRAAAEMAK